MGFLESIKKITEKFTYTKEFELDGVKVLLGLLTVDDERLLNSVYDDDKDLEGLSYINDLRKRVLSYAIKSIDGDDVPAVVEYTEGDKIVRKTGNVFMYDFLSGIPTVGIDILFEVYSDLKDEVVDSIEGKIKVNWYLTPSERDLRRIEDIRKRELEDEEKRKELQAERQESENKEDIKFREIKEKEIDTEEEKITTPKD